MKTYFLFICAICCYLTGNAHSTEYNIFQFGASKDTSVVQTCLLYTSPSPRD